MKRKPGWKGRQFRSEKAGVEPPKVLPERRALPECRKNNKQGKIKRQREQSWVLAAVRTGRKTVVSAIIEVSYRLQQTFVVQKLEVRSEEAVAGRNKPAGHESRGKACGGKILLGEAE